LVLPAHDGPAVIVAVGLATLSLVIVLQDRLLYVPARVHAKQVVSAELRPWPSAQNFRGLVAEPMDDLRGAVMVFHGNPGRVGLRATYPHAQVPLAWRVIRRSSVVNWAGVIKDGNAA